MPSPYGVRYFFARITELSICGHKTLLDRAFSKGAAVPSPYGVRCFFAQITELSICDHKTLLDRVFSKGAAVPSPYGVRYFFARILNSQPMVTKFDPNKHHRHSVRLKRHDYSDASCYFITICTYHRLPIFGKIVNNEMQLNDYGNIAELCWLAIPKHFPHVSLSEFVVMPNHVHGILRVLKDSTASEGQEAKVARDDRSGPRKSMHKREFGKPVPGSLATIMRSFKSATTKRINILREAPGTPVWQRNYHEHVIRDDASLGKIQDYVENNPRSWVEDQLHPDNPTKW